MKTNYFGLRFWQNRLLIFGAAIVLQFLFSLQIAAQPGDCRSMSWKPESCRAERDALLRKYEADLKSLDEQIARAPQNAELYYRRGRIYSAMIFEKSLGFQTVEFDGRVYFSEIDAKAIADYTKAINLAPQAAYFEERGNIYRAYWERETSPFGSGENLPREEILNAVERLFIGSENLKAARRDFQKAAELSADYETARPARQKLRDLHSVRAFSLGHYEKLASVISREKAADTALADQDYVIEHQRNVYARSQSNSQKDELRIRFDREYLYDALIDKGKMARNFGREQLALEAFNEAEKYWTKTNFNCFVFKYRASIFLRRGDSDAALRELTRALESGNGNCRDATQFRGDVYFRRGDWPAAIADYTTYLNSGYGKFSELFHKRGAAYLKTGEAEKAVADFDYLIDETYNKNCPQYFHLRAEAHRLTGETDLAEADEKAAAALPKNVKRPLCELNLIY